MITFRLRFEILLNIVKKIQFVITRQSYFFKREKLMCYKKKTLPSLYIQSMAQLSAASAFWYQQKH